MAEAGKWSDYFITEKGRALRQRVIAEKKTLVFTRAAIGTGRPADISHVDTMENLMAFNRNVQHYKSYVKGTNHFAVVRVDNTGYAQEILMSEVGIFAKEKDEPDSMAILYGYAYNLTSYVLIPEYANGNNHKVYEVTFDTALSQSSNVELIYDGSPIYASHHDLDEAMGSHNKDAGAHENILIRGNLWLIISPTGSDLNDGFTYDTPLRTVDEALRRSENIFVTDTKVVEFTEGIHQINKGISISKMSSPFAIFGDQRFLSQPSKTVLLFKVGNSYSCLGVPGISPYTAIRNITLEVQEQYHVDGGELISLSGNKVSLRDVVIKDTQKPSSQKRTTLSLANVGSVDITDTTIETSGTGAVFVHYASTCFFGTGNQVIAPNGRGIYSIGATVTGKANGTIVTAATPTSSTQGGTVTLG